ncbi:hypothetical protein B0920_09010 [Massilia sp. KIM]|uniref:hypothetical protein n=1 Tax=Massilia sp. KIM TaxID=1955422 RepID=UPI0009C53F0D|nr:hypothetical protein [Massilia sp. KIM]OON64698.1 hypothetical protein B0920_09010 [Massilia sp. KIM]
MPRKTAASPAKPAKTSAPKSAPARKAAVRSAPAKSTAPAKAGVKSAVKAAARTLAQAPAKKPVRKAPAAAPVRDATLESRPVLVRDSFTMPEQEYAVLAEVKQACLRAGIDVKKSELLRIGVALLGQLDVATLKTVLGALPQLKTGRPPAA